MGRWARTAILLGALALPRDASANDHPPPVPRGLAPSPHVDDSCAAARRLLASGRLSAMQLAQIRHYLAGRCRERSPRQAGAVAVPARD